MVTVPNLSGSTQYQAQRTLEQNGLSLGNVKQEYNEDVAVGIVYDQGVAQGTQVPEGFAIDIWISLGPEEPEPTDEPDNPDEPTDPPVTTDPDDPTVTTDPDEPTEPTDPSVTTDPTEPTDPTTTTDPNEPVPSPPDGI